MRCPVCGQESLSPLAELALTNAMFRIRFKRPGFGQSRPGFTAKHARACRSCGAVVPFLDHYELKQLDQTWADLIPIDRD